MRRGGICRSVLTGLSLSLVLSTAGRVFGDVPARVVALRHFASRAHTRIVVELSAPAVPALSTLPAREVGPPRRLYLDLPGVDVSSQVSKSLDVPVGPLAGIRIGKRDAGTTRVVIVIREVEAYELSRLGGPPRVVLDLRAPPRLPSREVDPGGAASQDNARRVGGKSSTAPREPQAERTPPGSQPTQSEPQNRRAQGHAGATHEPQAGPRRQAEDATPRASSPTIGPLKVVIDPGHGGKDPGARGPGGLLEKTVTLEVAKQVASGLRKHLGASVVLTRTRDVFVSLEARTALANAERADLFISIHANASSSRSLSGVETYYLENTDDRATLRLAAMENGLTLIGKVPPKRGQDLSYILSDLVQQAKLEGSATLARSLHRGLVKRLGSKHRDLVDLGVKRGPFYVLVGAYMPCALVEVSFLTNRAEGKRLGTESYRQYIAEGLVDGVVRYVADNGRARTL